MLLESFARTMTCNSERTGEKRGKWGQMWCLTRRPGSQDWADATSADSAHSCSDLRVEWWNWGRERRKRRIPKERFLRFIVGSPEGIRTLDLMAENHASWTARRRGHVSGWNCAPLSTRLSIPKTESRVNASLRASGLGCLSDLRKVVVVEKVEYAGMISGGLRRSGLC